MGQLRTTFSAMRQGFGLILLLWKGASKVPVAERIFSRKKRFVMIGKRTGFFVPRERCCGDATFTRVANIMNIRPPLEFVLDVAFERSVLDRPMGGRSSGMSSKRPWTRCGSRAKASRRVKTSRRVSIFPSDRLLGPRGTGTRGPDGEGCGEFGFKTSW